jgi:GNAT superfamily N-acetyltransferase
MEGTQVPPLDDLRFRLADVSDAAAIAALHADSWRRHYRGAYADAFLDGDVEKDRLAVWSERLGEPDRDTHTIVAEDGGRLIGFAHTVFEVDPRWGALLDNLHVVHGEKRRGIGSRLMALSARAAIKCGTGLYLWVLEQNRDARAFYESRGGRCVERVPVPSPGGVASRLIGSPIGLRYAWPDPRALDIRGAQDVEA